MTSTITLGSLSQFTGDDVRYRHTLDRHLIYTPGIRYLAEHGGAYWLIDAIASYFGSPIMQKAMNQDPRLIEMQFWTLKRDGTRATLSATADSDAKPFITQDIPFTDFPLEKIDIWAAYDGTFWTLYLPSEH